MLTAGSLAVQGLDVCSLDPRPPLDPWSSPDEAWQKLRGLHHWGDRQHVLPEGVAHLREAGVLDELIELGCWLSPAHPNRGQLLHGRRSTVQLVLERRASRTGVRSRAGIAHRITPDKRTFQIDFTDPDGREGVIVAERVVICTGARMDITKLFPDTKRILISDEVTMPHIAASAGWWSKDDPPKETQSSNLGRVRLACVPADNGLMSLSATYCAEDGEVRRLAQTHHGLMSMAHRDPGLGRLFEDAEPLAGIDITTRAVRTYFRRISGLPERVFIIGDALAHTNPSHALGLSIGSHEADLVARAMKGGDVAEFERFVREELTETYRIAKAEDQANAKRFRVAGTPIENLEPLSAMRLSASQKQLQQVAFQHSVDQIGEVTRGKFKSRSSKIQAGEIEASNIPSSS
jgi:2-polyprenyl-6-methoxyphenol hydroxylase-like FAD-dependent oxidoreductase